MTISSWWSNAQSKVRELYARLITRRSGSIYENRRIASLTTGLSVLLCFCLGMFLLSFTGWTKGWHHLWTELSRDLGIALIVASVIAIILEIYRYAHHRFGAMREMFDLIMSERITPEVWFELKDLIETKVCIRKNVHLRLSISPADPSLKNFQVLSVEYGYEIHSLVQRSTNVTVVHELDYQFRGLMKGLPRFTAFSIDPPDDANWETAPLANSGKDGRISFSVPLAGLGDRPRSVQINRQELIPMPGSYNLYTQEFIKGLTLMVADTPPGFDIEVTIRPQGPGESLRRAGSTWRTDQLILPGQGLEVKFMAAVADNTRSGHTAVTSAAG